MNNWLILLIAIISEVIATSALKASNGFTRLIPSLVVAVGYTTAFYCLSLTMKTIPVGIAYAVWSGLGLFLVTIIAWFCFGQKLDLPAILGMGLILAGVMVINMFSGTAH